MRIQVIIATAIYALIFATAMSAMDHETDRHQQASSHQQTNQQAPHDMVARKINALNNCVVQCERCVASCVDHEEHSSCVKFCRDCTDICSLTARLIARGSQFVPELSALSHQACKACSDECGKNTEDADCMNCAEACLNCIMECSMSEHH